MWRRFHFLNETDRRMLILCLSQMRMVADSTFILGIPWNPAILEQRAGRIHRMGQMENVTVVNMVSAESIAQRMHRSAATAGGRPQPAAAAPATPRELVQTGVSFFSGLAQTLSSPEKTRELVQSIVATDAETGQTYLKIPVESAAAVENAVRLLGGLLAGLGRG